MEFRTGPAICAFAASLLLLGTAPYGRAPLPHSNAALRAELAAPCSRPYVAARPLDDDFENAFSDVIGASATIKAYIGPDGRVTAADIVSASDDVTGATAISVLRSVRFAPARCGSEPEPGLFIARFN